MFPLGVHPNRVVIWSYLESDVAANLGAHFRQTMFEGLGSAVQFNKTTPSAHAWPTPDWGPPCGHGVIENCGYDGERHEEHEARG